MPEARRIALLPAAGSGSRMGAAVPKQYLTLRGEPVIRHTVRCFIDHVDIDRVVVVLSADDHRFGEIDWAFCGDRLTVLYCGGETRAETVRNGLRELAHTAVDSDWVLVHDAARPCLDRGALDRLLAELADDPVGGILALPVADTVKRGDTDARITETVPRDQLWLAQTPQMFRLGLLQAALEADAGPGVTDEASAIERLGKMPKLVLGSSRNLKITYPADLGLAELLLDSQQR